MENSTILPRYIYKLRDCVYLSFKYKNFSLAAICGSPPSILNGFYETPTTLVEGGKVTYSCNNHYQLLGSANATCENDREWRTVPSCLGNIIIALALLLFCIKMLILIWLFYQVYNEHFLISITAICGSPPSIPNGFHGAPTNTVAGGTVTYSCSEGYQLSGSANVTCDSDGNWKTVPTCLGIL